MKTSQDKVGIFASGCLLLSVIVIVEGWGETVPLNDPNIPPLEKELIADMDNVPLDNVEVMGPGGPTGRDTVILHKTLDALLLEDGLSEGHYSGTEIRDIKQTMIFDEWIKDFKQAGGNGRIPENIKQMLKIGGTNANELRARIKEEIGNRKGHRRRKRSTIAAYSGIWTNCVIPWKFDSSMYDRRMASEKLLLRYRNGAIEAMKYFEKYSGFRFVEYTGNNRALGLDHDNFAIFVYPRRGCWSYLGNTKYWKGQKISACDGMTAVHEIGHMLGMLHDQNDPRSLDVLRSDLAAVKPGYESVYQRVDLTAIPKNDGSFYDPSSIMHYGPRAYSKTRGAVMTMYDLDDQYLWGQTDNTFYVFRDLQKYYNCYSQFDSCKSMPTCKGGGYLSVLDNECSCRCPEGLDPATGCTSELLPRGWTRWPTGSYSILKTTLQDCPTGFEPGSIVAWPRYGAWSASKYHSAPFNMRYLQHDTCTKTNATTGEGSWPAGKYCIFRNGGACPTGFLEGTAYTYGEVPYLEKYTERVNKGVQPDGEHGNRTFVYIYCCRDDGPETEPIDLELADHVTLFPVNDYCQEVKDTFHEMESFVWRNAKGHGEITLTGSTPKIRVMGYGVAMFFFCVYFPIVKGECGVIKTFTNDTSYTFTTPNYPGNFPESHECYWRFESPPDTVMQIDFNSFSIPPLSPSGTCGAQVELRTWYPAFHGLKFCGNEYQKTHWTKLNYLTIKFSSDKFSIGRGFNATITIHQRDDHGCYNGDGSDGVYAGKVNYGTNFAACLYWDEVPGCPFNAFDPRVVDEDLIGHNYCRNIGVGKGPWCYIDKESCERQMCDACSMGACFDLWNGCLKHVKANPTYCTVNEFNEAERLCRKTCGLCVPTPKHYSLVSCSLPEDVESVTAKPAKSSYKVGEKVTYTCNATRIQRSRTCTSEGTWTNLTAVCNACPNGWAVHNKKCYKWLGYDVLLNQRDAKEACLALQPASYLPKVQSKDIAEFIQGMVDFEKGDYADVWLGLEYKYETSSWAYSDGSKPTYTRWSVYRRPMSETCVTMFKAWTITYCDRKRAYVVCEVDFPNVDDTSSCVDTSDNCADALERTPDLCTKYPDYAWHNCRVTCGVGVCKNDTQQSQTTAAAGSDKAAGEQPVPFTGTEPASPELGHVFLNADTISMKSRPYETSSSRDHIVTSTNEFMRTPAAGVVTSFIFYSNFLGKRDKVYFFVLRHTVTDKYGMAFKVIHSIRIKEILENRITKFKIPATITFDVEKGDYIAFYQSGMTISFSQCSKQVAPKHDGWMHSIPTYRYGYGKIPVAGDEVGFRSVDRNPNNRCRVYSIWYEMDQSKKT